MKVKVTNKSFYGNKINQIGDIIEINEKKCPSWAELVEECKEENLKKADIVENNEEISDAKDDIKSENMDENIEADLKIEELSKLKDDEIKEMLDNLLDEAINKGIMIEFENKSDIALIMELTELLKGKK